MIERFDGEYKFLSNFYAYAPVEYEGLVYPTSEHAFQAAKTFIPELKLRFTDFSTSPGAAKRMGREIPIRTNWETVKDQVMLDILRIKFKIPALRELLLKTGTANLVEGNNWHDKYWGICEGSCKTPHPGSPQGLNKLGKLLERVRYEISEVAS